MRDHLRLLGAVGLLLLVMVAPLGAQTLITNQDFVQVSATDVNTTITPTWLAHVTIINDGPETVWVMMAGTTATATSPSIPLFAGEYISSGTSRVRVMGLICAAGESASVRVFMTRENP